MHCRRFVARPQNRREMLRTCAQGFGSVALAALLQDWGLASPNPTLGTIGTHHAPKARNIIFLYMDGGPSHVDTFDHKPILNKFDGQDPHQAIGDLEPTQFNAVGKVMKSPWKFQRRGESGNWISDLFPHLSAHIDDIAFVKGMTSRFSEHTSANYFLHTGSGFQGRPSIGAWIDYAISSENENLPGFVVLNGGLIPPGGLDNFNSGFLPASHQGSVFAQGDEPVANVHRQESKPHWQRNKLDLVNALDRFNESQFGPHDAIEAAIVNYETAYQMQTSIPELMDFSQETPATLEQYGCHDDWKGTQIYGRQCLLARRLIERGVRFIELTCPNGNGDRWDQHGGLREGHTKNSRSVDRPIAALLSDLKERGLFDSTLIVFAGEFGRTPFAQGSDGRDHNPFGFTVWLAGAGIQGGVSHGETDEWGYKAIAGKQEIHDLHATMLHLLGLDHERSTFRFGGRDMRLTDVHGHVIREILT